LKDGELAGGIGGRGELVNAAILAQEVCLAAIEHGLLAAKERILTHGVNFTRLKRGFHRQAVGLTARAAAAAGRRPRREE
jgi:hypothetical protein